MSAETTTGSDKPKVPVTPKQNGVVERGDGGGVEKKSRPHIGERPDVQARRQLDYVRGALKSSRERAFAAKNKTKEQQEAREQMNIDLASMPDMGSAFSGKTPVQPDNYVDSPEVMDVKKHEKLYREQLTKTYEVEKKEVGYDPKKYLESTQKYIKEYVDVFSADKKELQPNDILKMSQEVPELMKDMVISLRGKELKDDSLFGGKKMTQEARDLLRQWAQFTENPYTSPWSRPGERVPGSGGRVSFDAPGDVAGLSGGSSGETGGGYGSQDVGSRSFNTGERGEMASSNTLLNMLGGSKEAIEKQLTTVTFMGKKTRLHRLMIPIMQDIERDIKADPEANKYTVHDFQGYNWRLMRNGNSLSKHSFGIAFDINPNANMGSFGDGGRDMPDSFVRIMKKHGMNWGGDWKKPYDPMHFEFSNPALLSQALQRHASTSNLA